MHPLREQVKRYLIGARPSCALCGVYASQLHEVVCPLKNKYNPSEDDEKLARLVYLPQNCVLLCGTCNVITANSRRDELIQHNMDLYGVDAVVGVYKSMSRLLKAPKAYIPTSVSYKGKIVRIL